VGDTPRRLARDLIVAVLDNMQRYQEPLMYSILVPNRYLVYLHPAEYARLEGILPIVREQTVRGLVEAVEKLNRPSLLQQYAGRILRTPRIPVESAAGGWHVEFLEDPDGEVPEGAFVVDSELRSSQNVELGAGDRTRRITTVHLGQRVSTRERTVMRQARPDAPRSDAHVLARLTHEDEAGRHSYEVMKDSITIGRGGTTYPVDIAIVSSADVSREHARIRRDPQTGAFFLIDLSSLGTTLNGRHVPRGYDEVDGTKRENGVETPLPDQTRIGLAETVYLQFEVVSQ
jgi:hypothetical protein